ncbi:hypothetical protein G7076_00700 [Sphingomonas sp. HDW15A]|uniref:hypothetical protein n=1 Tax=Sphingomonas sp. HDW15A TaxID=2714942 RepID=UPI0014081FAA|nr:hypothetical protein [Sphingomonas sp. HDW15A]QIK95205.1 hypothetical protein G7076_00700 [Sphingomonas sp. HDW15A]
MRVFALFIPLLTSACVVGTVAETAVDVAVLPVKAVAKGVDLATTSQSEADEKRGREMRKAEEAYGKRLREWEKRCARAEREGQSCPPRPEFVPPAG